MNKTEVKKILDENGFKMWELAEVMGIDDTRLSKLLRREPNAQVSAKLLNGINKLVEGFQYDEYEKKKEEAIRFLVVDVGLNPDEYEEWHEKLTCEQVEED